MSTFEDRNVDGLVNRKLCLVVQLISTCFTGPYSSNTKTLYSLYDFTLPLIHVCQRPKLAILPFFFFFLVYAPSVLSEIYLSLQNANRFFEITIILSGKNREICLIFSLFYMNLCKVNTVKWPVLDLLKTHSFQH